MKVMLFVVLVVLALGSFGVEVPALPPPEFVDTEVSTNFTFAVGAGSNRRLIFSLELEATPMNNVEIAIGCDADEDGLLASNEAALVVGYDCGEWLMRSSENDSVTYSDVADSGVFRRTYEVRSRQIDPSWNLVNVTRRGLDVSNANVSFFLVESGFGLTIR